MVAKTCLVVFVLIHVEVVEAEKSVQERLVEALQTVEQGQVVRGPAERSVSGKSDALANRLTR